MTAKITWTNETRKLSELKPWGRNPRQIDKASAERLADSLQKARSFQAVKYIMETYPNASKFTRQYDIGDRGEWGYLETYLSHKQIDNEARRLHKALGL